MAIVSFQVHFTLRFSIVLEFRCAIFWSRLVPLVRNQSIRFIPKRNFCHFSHYNFLQKTQLHFIYTGLPQVREENFKVRETSTSFTGSPILPPSSFTPGGPWKVVDTDILKKNQGKLRQFNMGKLKLLKARRNNLGHSELNNLFS